jgi:hypothetical protein
MVYDARGKEYGTDKYERANFIRPAAADPFDVRANFERYREYLRATLSHVVETLDAMESHQAGDPLLEDADGMRAAAYAPDTDETPGAKVGPSYLPHVSHAIASMTMAIEQATRFGLLPKDPGQPWKCNASAPGFVDSLSGKRHTLPKEWIRKQLGGTPEARAIVDDAIVIAAKTPETIGESVAKLAAKAASTPVELREMSGVPAALGDRVARYGVDELDDVPPVALSTIENTPTHLHGAGHSDNADEPRCGNARAGYVCERRPHADKQHTMTEQPSGRVVQWRDRSED